MYSLATSKVALMIRMVTNTSSSTLPPRRILHLNGEAIISRLVCCRLVGKPVLLFIIASVWRFRTPLALWEFPFLNTSMTVTWDSSSYPRYVLYFPLPGRMPKPAGCIIFYLNNGVFLSRNYRLIVAPRKFDVLKTNICPRSEASRANMLVLRTSNFQGATIRPIVPRHKHSIVFIVHY